MLQTLTISTSKKRELVDITDQVEKVIHQSNTEGGCIVLFVRHTTCSIIITEVEGNLEKDIIRYLEEKGPKGPFVHSHGDLLAHDPQHAGQSHAPAHLLSATIGQSIVVPLNKGSLLLGTWQRICLLELDGPRTREVVVQLLS